MSIRTACLGYPRMGGRRELKKAMESFWAGKSSAEELQVAAADLRARHWRAMTVAGIDQVPVGDFSLYDHMLDMAVMLGAVPPRFLSVDDGLLRYFAMARGMQAQGVDLPALEMTKWFDTNYHYIVPQLAVDQEFSLDAGRLVSEIEQAQRLGVAARPVIIGPVSFLLLSKHYSAAESRGSAPLDLLDGLLPVYVALLARLEQAGVDWVQIDEPCLVLALDEGPRTAYRKALSALAQASHRPRVMLTSYFGGLRENLSLALDSGLDGLHLDVVRGDDDLAAVLRKMPQKMTLSLGAVDGRNIWRTDLDVAHAKVRQAVTALTPARVVVAGSCSFLHVPVTLDNEPGLDGELRTWLAFAEEKCVELRALADAGQSERGDSALFVESRAALARRKKSPRTHCPAVRARAALVDESMLQRQSGFAARVPQQRQLPSFPCTTIGSFPQTAEIRRARMAWRKGAMSTADYEMFLEDETRQCIARQERIGLDVLVHGEFERTDMVEYFGERLDGFAFTKNGWVQSYGSRCVKPPILFGDVARPSPMTVRWSRFAQSLTTKPVKGMLTGPVTILQWSFVRDDQPRRDTCQQIALALRDEVDDLEQAGIDMIQVDEPAIREGLPLRQVDQKHYLRWAVDAFRLATCGAADSTQIHTHMCYSEFGDMLAAIAEMDADVLSIETSRSNMELLTDFALFHYPNEIGPGVYDIHSPRIPSPAEMTDLLTRAAAVLPSTRLWVNPDCGLKTRSWPEVEGALHNMVAAARSAAQQLAP